MKIYNHLKLLMLVSFALSVATMAAGNVDSRTAQADAFCGQAVQTQYSRFFSYADKENIREAMIKCGYSTSQDTPNRQEYNY